MSAGFRSREDPAAVRSALQLRGGAEGKTVLVTGGVGYSGSHTVLELLNAGYEARAS